MLAAMKQVKRTKQNTKRNEQTKKINTAEEYYECRSVGLY